MRFSRIGIYIKRGTLHLHRDFTGFDLKWSLLIVVAPFEVKCFYAGTPHRLSISYQFGVYGADFKMLAIRSKMVDLVNRPCWIPSSIYEHFGERFITELD